MKELLLILSLVSAGIVAQRVISASASLPSERISEIEKMNRETWGGAPPEGVIREACGIAR